MTEDLCRVQADVLGMGPDNYRRLCRVCPDPARRYRVLRARVERRLPERAAPPQARSRAAEGAAILAAGGGVRVEFEWQGVPRDAQTHATSADAYVAGEPSGSERCWRCNARSAAGELGLCESCHAELAARDADDDG